MVHAKSLTAKVFSAALLCVVVGCGGSDLPSPVSVTPAAPPALKGLLEDIANSGELGSGSMTIPDELNNLEKTDAAKGKELKDEFARLQKLTDPEAIKAQAKKMAAKL